ncbi:HAD family hydrolase [uncultured Prevotella sp.]|uniref:HAD family hydrolase n=1 Tax=uncultured Prevotella sp. TaxID=159272 RepID=UPI0026047D7D|nr:HAD family hydrolase [uncultured Prevotella sp.]
MKEFDTYIFDLDGTLLYTLGDLTASTNYAMRAFNMPEHTTEEVRMMVGNGIKKLIERAVPEGNANKYYEEVYNTFIEHYLKHNADTTKPYEGITDMLATLKQHGKKIAVVSNKYCKATEELCHRFFSEYIKVAIGESDKIKKKPAPDTVNEALKILEAERNNAVYVGDSEVDIQTAVNSGMPCISVLWGFRDRDFLIKNGAQTLIENPNDIVACLK